MIKIQVEFLDLINELIPKPIYLQVNKNFRAIFHDQKTLKLSIIQGSEKWF